MSALSPLAVYRSPRRPWLGAVVAVFAAHLDRHIKTREMRSRFEDLTRVYEEVGR